MLEFLECEQRLLFRPCRFAMRQAVEAAEITPISQRDPKIADRPIVGVAKHYHYDTG